MLAYLSHEHIFKIAGLLPPAKAKTKNKGRGILPFQEEARGLINVTELVIDVYSNS